MNIRVGHFWACRHLLLFQVRRALIHFFVSIFFNVFCIGIDLLYSPLFSALKEEEVLNFDSFNWLTFGAVGRVAKLIAKVFI